MDRIDPQTASGFRDVLPADAAARQRMSESIATVCERFGFVPIDTPVLERLDVLLGEGNMEKQIFRARLTEDDDDMGLRFDLTVPLARYVAAHADKLQMPFRRYHIGKTWRGEHAQAGRYREFVQADADIIGSKDVAADAEVIALMYEAFERLGAADVTFRIGHRKILNGLVSFAGLGSEKTAPVLRSVDKLDKLGWEGVKKELSGKGRLSEQSVDSIRAFLEASRGPVDDVLVRIRKLLEFSADAHEGVDELERMIEYMDALHVPRERWEMDLSIARGLGYYTGPVFETRLNALPELGSVCSGGRYDSLVSRFAPMELSGTGGSIGLDRLFAGLDTLERIEREQTGASVAVLNFHEPATKAALNLVTTIRNDGIGAQVYLGSEDTLKGQLAWAVKSGISYVAIIGPAELDRGTCQLKDLQRRDQQEVAFADVSGVLKQHMR